MERSRSPKLQWQRLGKYAMGSGGWIIGKFIVDGVPIYGLFLKDKAHGKFKSFDDAAAAAKLHGERRHDTGADDVP